MSNELFTRHPHPILTVKDLVDHVPASAVFNPGVGDWKGKTFLYARVQDYEGLSSLIGFTSVDGITDWKIDRESIFRGGGKTGKDASVEDARLTWMGKLNKWAIVYTHLIGENPLVSIDTTEDFRKFRHFGNVLPSINKDAALFSEPIKGYYWLIHRPTGIGRDEIWLARARDTGSDDDFSYWGHHQVLLSTDGTRRWDGKHIGINPPPLKTEEGWLLMYHGTRRTASGVRYYLGLAMLSLDDPRIVTHRTKDFIMWPLKEHDFTGDVPGAIFPCGWRIDKEDDKEDELRLYFGSVDMEIWLTTALLKEVIDRVLQDPV